MQPLASAPNRVTRRFQQQFRATHAALASALRGVDSAAAPSAAAVLLHRLMFLSFLRWKGLGSDHPASSKRSTKYRRVLQPLFRRLHLEMTESAAKLDVSDDALAQVLSFLNSCEWTLSEQPAAGAIDRRLLGALLEQYVNQQQMGAYYTGEDITGYIARCAILPYVLDRIEKQQPGGLAKFTACWHLLRTEPERYLYPSVRHGVERKLPPRIAAGLRNVAARAVWGEPTPPEFGLPTETWRETIARRRHCQAVRRRLRTGRVRTVDELLTLNLDLARFTSDALESCSDVELLQTAYGILESTTVVDPTCGSGAFLVAALHVLVPLYDACLRRLEQLLPTRTTRHGALRVLLQKASQPPGREAFIVRTVLENNLHGFDVMPEAVDVCKLRLLLEWAATLERMDDPAMLGDVRLQIHTADILGPIAPTKRFDVVIGNPPYVEVAGAARKRLDHFRLAATGNLFSICLERFTQWLRPGGRLGVIVPLSAVSTPRMLPLMHLLRQEFAPLHIANFAVRPAKLFVGVDMNLSILLGRKDPGGGGPVHTTRYQRWQPAFRSYLFDNLPYTGVRLVEDWAAFPKIGTTLEASILRKLQACQTAAVWNHAGADTVRLYCHSGGRYFRKCLHERLSEEYKEIRVPVGWADALLCLLSSSLYYWFWLVISDCYHLTHRDLAALPMAASLRDDARFTQLAKELTANVWTHASRRQRLRAGGSHQEEINFDMSRCRPVLDRIDRVLAEHYGLTGEETDLILAYDHKFRGEKPAAY